MNFSSPNVQSADNLSQEGESSFKGGVSDLSPKLNKLEYCLDYVELVDDVVVVCGWVLDSVDALTQLKVGPTDTNKITQNESDYAEILTSDQWAVPFTRISRWDVSKYKSIDIKTHSHKHGFVFAARTSFKHNSLYATYKSGLTQEFPLTAQPNTNSLYNVVEHSGYELYSQAAALLGVGHSYVKSIMALSESAAKLSSTISGVDKCLNVSGEFLFVNGWVAADSIDIQTISVRDEKGLFDGELKLTRHFRADLAEAFPELGSSPLGYCVALPIRGVLGREVTLDVIMNDGRIVSAKLDAQYSDWINFLKYTDQYISKFPYVMQALVECQKNDGLIEPSRLRVEAYRRSRFRRYANSLCVHLEVEGKLVAAVDSVYVVGSKGLFFTGWHIQLDDPIVDIRVCLESGEEHSIKDGMFMLPRADLVSVYGEKYGDISLRCGYVVYSPETSIGEGLHILRYVTTSGGQIDIKLEAYGAHKKGVRLIEDMVQSVPSCNLIHSELYSLFESGLGRAIETVNNDDKCSNMKYQTHEFGSRPDGAEVSVIIPLYGRYDFVRYQLAEFANDEYMLKQEIIFVIDDPRIINEVYDLASKYFQLFKVPFKIIQYNKNLGYAGANNVGVSAAGSELVLLLNSDIIPTEKNWLQILVKSYRNTPEVGAIGPLLKFYDDSIQHAGMYPKRNKSLPGFILNYHKNMGMSWNQAGKVESHPMITGACMLLSKELYDGVGGLDDNYVIGDFEDSDLCLSIRKTGKGIYLDSSVELWHLERQSQTINKTMSVRQLITMYNGWRYTKKIQAGLISDPEKYKFYATGEE